MKDLRNTVSTTPIPRTGTLIVTQIIALAALGEAVAAAKEEGREVDQDAIAGAGTYEITLEKNGAKSKKLATIEGAHGADEAAAFVAGFKACADVRRVQNRKKPAKPPAGADS
jgi:hypothetical protein